MRAGSNDGKKQTGGHDDKREAARVFKVK